MNGPIGILRGERVELKPKFSSGGDWKLQPAHERNTTWTIFQCITPEQNKASYLRHPSFFPFFHLDCLVVCPSGAVVVLSNFRAGVKLISHRDSHSFWTKMDNNVTTDADKDKQVTLPARVWTLPPLGPKQRSDPAPLPPDPRVVA